MGRGARKSKSAKYARQIKYKSGSPDLGDLAMDLGITSGVEEWDEYAQWVENSLEHNHPKSDIEIKKIKTSK